MGTRTTLLLNQHVSACCLHQENTGQRMGGGRGNDEEEEEASNTCFEKKVVHYTAEVHFALYTATVSYCICAHL